jgi:geranylgeranyl diphosphate synthase type I
MESEIFHDQLKSLKRRVDDELRQFFRSAYHLFPIKEPSIGQQLSLIKQACLSNGKRIRPIISIMAYRAFAGKKEPVIIPASLPLELFHNYTLIHDDIYDEDATRRGVATNHSIFINSFIKHSGSKTKTSLLYKNSATRFGVVSGIINGKLLHALSFWLLNRLPISPVKKLMGINMLIRQSINDNVGQSIDLAIEEDLEIGEKEYFTMVYYKTGCLLKTSIEWGAFLGGATKRQRSLLSSYMEELGYIFQIKDDLIDIGIGGKKGHRIGSDIKKGKRTLPIIYALKNSDKKEKRQIFRILGNESATKKEIGAVVKLIKDKKAPEYCERIAERKMEKAFNFLEQVSPLKNESEQFFRNLAHFMWERKK